MPVRWRIFTVIALGSFVSYVLRSNISLAAPAMKADLGLGDGEWGLVLSAFIAGYAIFQFPGGLAGDRFGPRKALTIIALLWTLLTLATALVPGPMVAGTGLTLTLLIVVRFLVGAAHAPIFPVQNTVFANWFPPGSRGLPVGLSSTALTLGLAATAPLLSWMIILFGWRIAFVILAPAGLLVAGLWWWYGRDRPADHPAMTAPELEVIEGDRGLAQAAHIEPPAGSWKRILKNRDVLLLMASYSCMNFIFYQVFNYFYQYLVEQRGFDAVTAGWVTSSQWIAGAVGAAFGGWLCDRLSRRLGLRWGARWPIIIGLLLSGSMLLAGSLSTQADIAVILFVGCFLFNQITEGAYWSASISIGGRLAGTAGGIMNTGANLMGIVNANLVPLIAHALGWTSAIASGALFAVLGSLFMLAVRADKRADLP